VSRRGRHLFKDAAMRGHSAANTCSHFDGISSADGSFPENVPSNERKREGKATIQGKIFP